MDSEAIDPIFQVIEMCAMDSHPKRVDLGIGVYMDSNGKTPIFDSIRDAERQLVCQRATKAYTGLYGLDSYREQVSKLVLGETGAGVTGENIRILQTCGGTAALRICAQLAKDAGQIVHIGQPSWENHLSIMRSTGAQTGIYQYYNSGGQRVSVTEILEYTSKLSDGDALLLQGCCHNPTGADLADGDWMRLSEELGRNNVLPIVDLAYQGLSKGIVEDAFCVKALLKYCPRALISVSSSKNLGLYQDRVGALITVAEDRKAADRMHKKACEISRDLYAMPPAHGAAVAAMVLQEPALRKGWEHDLALVRKRISDERMRVSAALRAAGVDCGYVENASGLFSILPMGNLSVIELREKYHIYMQMSGRINVTAINGNNIDYVVASLASLFSKGGAAAGRDRSF